MAKQSKWKTKSFRKHLNNKLKNKEFFKEFMLLQDEHRIGELLRAAREAAGYTQEELARELGLHKPNISRLENSPSNVTLKTILKYLNALDKNLELRISG